jgi:hypothetical protein
MALPELLKQAGGLLHRLLAATPRSTSDPTSECAGEWVQQAVAAHPSLAEVSVVCQAGPLGQIDAYWPNRRWLVLAPHSFTSQTVNAFSAAAHEMGHAIVQRRHRLLGTLFQGARLGQAYLAYGLTAWVGLHFFLLGPIHPVMTQGLCAGLFLCSAVVLLDEGAASVLGHQLLARSGRDGLDVLLHLFSAWCLYALHTMGRVAQWALLPTLLSGPLPIITPAWVPFDFNPLLFLAILTLMLCKRSFGIVKKAVSGIRPHTLSQKKRQSQRESAGQLFGALGAVTLVFFMGSPQADPALVACLFLALVATAIPLVTLASVALSWPFRAIWVACQTSDHAGRKAKGSPHNAPPMGLELLAGPEAFRPLFAIAQLTFLPLVVLWWIQKLAELTL